MGPKHFPYVRTGLTPEVEGRAFAAAGVLEAAYGDSWSLETARDIGKAEAKLRSLVLDNEDWAGLSFKWRHASRIAGTKYHPTVTDADLARVWTETLRSHAGPERGPARLLVEPADGSWSPDEAAGLPATLRLLQGPLAAARDTLFDWHYAPPDLVGAVAIATGSHRSRYAGHDWGWPTRAGAAAPLAGPSLARTLTAERDLMVPHDGNDPDLLLSPHLLETPPRVGGIVIVTDTRLEQPKALMSRLSAAEIGRRPEALVPVPQRALRWFLTDLVHEISHDAPVDIALSWAWARHGGRRAAPLLLVANERYFIDMDASRLRRRVAELSRDLRAPFSATEPLRIGRDLSAFGLDYVETIQPDELADAIDRALSQESIRFDSERQAGEQVSAVRRVLAEGGFEALRLRGARFARIGEIRGHEWHGMDAPETREAIESAPEPGADIETDRFTDLALHRGFYYGGDEVEPARVLTATEALDPHSEYTLEVAIRKEVTGIEAAGGETPVRNPRQGREDVTVFAVVSCRQPDAPRFKDAMLRLTWPFENDSTPAFFRFETGAALPPEPLKVEVRLYALAGLQLLDLLELTYAFGKWTKVRPDTGPAAVAPPPSGAVQSAVSFHIMGAPDGFGIEALFLSNGKVHLEAPLGRAILAGDLETLLLRVRNYWTRLVIGKMSTRLDLTPGGYAEALAELAALGGAAWRTLFGDRREAQQGTPEAVGELMRKAPLPPDSPIRVTLAGDAETFVFPWAILCPPLRRNEHPDPTAIWGLRYMIELTRKYVPPYRHEGGKGVRIATAIDPGFAGSVDHLATLARIAALGPGAQLLDGNSEADVLDRLEAVPPADMYYYFCHGLSPGRASPLSVDVVNEMEKMLAALPKAESKPWNTLLTRMKSDPGVASMYTGAAAITEDKLRTADFFRGRRPIVFLNMCHSADLLPSMRSGLTHVFIERNAAVVLGTECPVTSIFADMFAEQVLTDLLSGQTIGEAVLAARRHFHAKRNPLGLLYTLYGHADARLTDPPPAQTEKDLTTDDTQGPD